MACTVELVSKNCDLMIECSDIQNLFKLKVIPLSFPGLENRIIDFRPLFQNFKNFLGKEPIYVL